MVRLRHAAQQLPLIAAGPRHRPRPTPLVLVAAAALVLVASFAAAPGNPQAAATAAGQAPKAIAGSVAQALPAGSPATAGPQAAAAPTSPPTGAPAAAAPAVAGGAGAAAPAAAGVPQAALPRAEEPSPSTTPMATPTAPPPATGTLTPELATALTKRLAALRTQYGIPGVEATIIFADGRSWRAHAGFQNYGARTPVQNPTPFPVASVTKTFLAALVVQLAQEGRFGLEDTLVTYLPAAKVDPRVTIRELLDHTSGIYDFFSNSLIDAAILGCRTCAWTPARSLSYVKKQLFAPGTGWSYSNTNYVLLGQLVEAVTGETYASLLRARFFEPLGLISTFVQGKEGAPYPVVHSYKFSTSSRTETPKALWDGTGIGPFRSLATAAGSAGDIASSARDLAVWARALYSGRVLGLEGLNAMLDFSGSLLLRSRIPYGLGVEKFTVAGRTAYGHGGRLMGARSAIRYLPTESMSIAVVINTDRGDPAVIANALATIALPPLVPPPPMPTPTPYPTATPTPIGLPSPPATTDPDATPTPTPSAYV